MTAPGHDVPSGQDIPSGQDVPPTCYRHPDRETWVSCVRCGRHACPDCLREAAVGQQCVECVRGANAGGRAARTVFGGRPAAGAVVTWTLVGINVLVFLVEVAKPSLLYQWGMLGTAALTPAGIQSGVANGQWYRLLTSAFTSPGTSLNGLGFLDILFNMWALSVVGPSLEQVLGRVRFLAVYLLSAVGGSVLFFYLQPHGLAAGASGAIYGLFGAWFVVARKLHLDVRGILTIIGINLAFSLFFRSSIAWQDHVGGLIVGVVTAAAFAYAPRKNRTIFQAGAALLILVILIVITLLRSHQLTSQLGL
jgi:membrane associated rhomboid family serine protease